MNITTQEKVKPTTITRRQLAVRWRVSLNTMIRRESEGILTPLPIGGRTVRYSLAAIERLEIVPTPRRAVDDSVNST